LSGAFSMPAAVMPLIVTPMRRRSNRPARGEPESRVRVVLKGIRTSPRNSHLEPTAWNILYAYAQALK
jgi:hypothetical protein